MGVLCLSEWNRSSWRKVITNETSNPNKSFQFYPFLFHPLTGFADLKGKQKRTEGKTVCTYAEP